MRRDLLIDILISIAVLLVALAYATRADGAPALRPVLPTFEATAINTWSNGTGTLPPCGRPRYAWVADIGPNAEADADKRTCIVRFDLGAWSQIRADDDLGLLCVVMVHEIGHLYGHDHSTKGVMTADISVTWIQVPACRRVLYQPEPKAGTFDSGAPLKVRPL